MPTIFRKDYQVLSFAYSHSQTNHLRSINTVLTETRTPWNICSLQVAEQMTAQLLFLSIVLLVVSKRLQN